MFVFGHCTGSRLFTAHNKSSSFLHDTAHRLNMMTFNVLDDTAHRSNMMIFNVLDDTAHRSNMMILNVLEDTAHRSNMMTFILGCASGAVIIWKANDLVTLQVHTSRLASRREGADWIFWRSHESDTSRAGRGPHLDLNEVSELRQWVTKRTTCFSCPSFVKDPAASACADTWVAPAAASDEWVGHMCSIEHSSFT